jgi:hypothetical protein
MHTSTKRHGARFLVAVVLAIFTGTELARASAVRPCAPHGRVPGALVDCGTWIAFSPPRPFDPTRGVFPRKRELRVALAQLHQEADRLRRTNLPFVFGAAYDASWNVAEGPVGQHWGLHSDNGAPKAAVLALQARVALEPAVPRI